MSASWRCPGCGASAALPQDSPLLTCAACGQQARLTRSTVTVDPGQTAPEVPSSPSATLSLGGTLPGDEFPSGGDARAPVGYEILGELGRGGMGVVYSARHKKLNRVCALKMILAGGHAGDAERERFATEAQAIARLQHPNIVQVFEVGEHQGHAFMALELCGGGSLDKRLREKPPTPQEAGEIVQVLALAMQAAHEARVIHRDLKPANVLLANNPASDLREGSVSSPGKENNRERTSPARLTPKITDFGLAKKLDEEGQTHTGSVMGTPSYMPPEQARGEKDLGPAVDVYALGAILYECLTGRPPFRGATAWETLLQVIENEPVAVRHLNPQVPPDLETICHKCLQKDVTKRYATAQELADDLGRFLRGEPARARPVGAMERGYRWVRRNPMVSGLAAVVLLVLTVGVVVSWMLTAWALNEKGNAEYQASEAKTARDLAREEALAARTAEEKATALAKAEIEAKTLAQRETKRVDTEKREAVKQLDRAERLVYAGKLSLAQSAFAEGKGPVGIQHLNECQWNLRGWEHRYLWTQFNSKQTFRGHTSYVFCVAFSPDGKHILSGSADTTLKLWDAETGQEIRTLKGHTSSVISVSFCPGGKRVLSGSGDKTLKLWDVETGQELRTFIGHTDSVFRVAFNPTGKRIISGSREGILKVWDADTGQEIRTLRGHTNYVCGVSYSPDGKRILSGSADWTLKLWDAEQGQEIRTFGNQRIPVGSVAFSPDGKRIVSGGHDGRLKLWDTEKEREILDFKGDTGEVRSVSFSPDGKRILTGSGGILKLWDAETGQELGTLQGHTDYVYSVCFSPDGKRILSGSRDETLKMWDADKGYEFSTLKGHTDRVASVAFSPDGKRILSGGLDKTLKLWDAEKRQEILTLRGHNAMISSVSFSPDGKRILSGSWDKTLKLWNAQNGQEVRTFKGHEHQVRCVAFSPDNKHVLSGSDDSTVKLWNVETGLEIRTFNGHRFGVFGVSISPDGKRILSGANDRTVKLWDVEKGQEIRTHTGHTGSVTSVSFSPDGKRFLSGSADKNLKLWNVDTGEEIFTLRGHTSAVQSVAFSPDGKRILSGSYDQTLKLWDADSGQEMLTLKGHAGYVYSVAFSPDGQRILSGSEDRTLKLWEAENEPEIRTLYGHTGKVTSISFSTDGKRILSGSEDCTLRLWDVEKGQEIRTLKGHAQQVRRVGFGADSQHMVGWDTANHVLAWSSETGQLVDSPAKPHQIPVLLVHGFLTAKANGYTIEVSDSRRPPTITWLFPDETERQRYHSEKAEGFEKAGDWFAAAFHRERLLLDKPWNAQSHIRLADLYAKLGQRERAAMHLLRGVLLNPQVRVDASQIWRYNGGYFEEQGGGFWLEKARDGEQRFREVTRNNNYIELHDNTRGFSIRLSNESAHIRGGSFKEWSKLYDGRWVR